MKGSDSLEEVINTHFKSQFDTLELILYDQSKTLGFNSFIKLKNKYFKLQLLNDRGLVEIGLSPIFGIEDFRVIESYYSLIKLSEEELEDSEKRKIITTRLSYEDQSSFLVFYSNELNTLFKKENYQKTLQQLNELHQL